MVGGGASVVAHPHQEGAMHLRKVISGGQTGVDRGAIGAALHAGFPYGGMIPSGRQAEDGQVPACFTEMVESTGGYAQRTRENVDQSDGNLILNPSPRLDGGTKLTAEIAQERGAQLLVLDVGRLYEWRLQDEPAKFFGSILVDQIMMWLRLRWLGLHPVHILNVAGPRESKAPGIEAMTYSLMSAVICGALQEA